MSQGVSGPFRFGEGKISGWISVVLGALSVLGVLCFRFPDYLTTPQLRAAYRVDEMRYLLAGGMIFSAAASATARPPRTWRTSSTPSTH